MNNYSKEIVRKKIKDIRSNQTLFDNRKMSSKIKEKLFSLLDFKSAETVLFYISYEGEVYTHDMIRESFYNKNVIVPVSNQKDLTLVLSRLKTWEELSIGSYRILEPKKEKIRNTNIEDIDLLIIPGVAFNEKGDRLGHGKGYYDKILNKTKSLKIGLAFEFQILEKIPTESHDVPVDMIITESRIIDCVKNR